MKRRTTDVLVNGTSGSGGDTGLYELYDNVVAPFMDAMISKAEAYRDATGFQNPGHDWKPRTYPTDPAQTEGVSYCYGCKETIETFVDTVSTCEVANPVPSNYRGNTDDNDCTVNSSADADWPGLYFSEWKLWNDDPNDPNDAHGDMRYYPQFWAGVDCSGLVMRACDYAAAQLGASVSLLTTIRSSCTFFFSAAACQAAHQHISDPPSGFTHNYGPLDGITPKANQRIQRGDLVSYDGHISIVYSERPTIVGNDVRYQIIHASGYNSICYTPPGGGTASCNFNRKVVVNEIKNELTSNTLKNPIGFGRIKLWQ